MSVVKQQAEHLIDRLIAAYNARDADAFANCFADDAVIYEHPNFPKQVQKAEFLEYYVKLFKEFPQNHTERLYRAVIDNRVIDHELVMRTPESKPFEVLTIYEVRNNLIQRVDFVRNTTTAWKV
ncbi:MAG: SgcJ/EcaC family oxidoreductase [Candidatus Kapaibacterium sp.]|nr:MAG: SgcJ/EcaC family oxidoreductase [Candidatus Kapabacteria bacterium]